LFLQKFKLIGEPHHCDTAESNAMFALLDFSEYGVDELLLCQ